MAPYDLPLLPLILDDVPRGLRQALVQEGIAFRDRRPGPPEGRFVLFDSRSGTPRAVAAGQVALDVDSLRDGFEEDPFAALVDERAGRFRWQIGGFSVTEEVARVDKRAVRQRLLGRLRARLEQAGGVWLRVAAFPFGYRSALNFRIDYDQYDAQDFNATLEAITGNEQATSHFVSGAAYAQAGDALARLRELDVGSHGYWHHTYRTTEENRRNVALGIETLRAAGIEPSGFAAPHGRFNRGLLCALESLGVDHSSEFGLAYDELPFCVGTAEVLEIPVHALSLGVFLEAAQQNHDGHARPAERMATAAVDAAVDHFITLAEAKWRAGEPVFLYGHPTGRLGRYPHVLRKVFAAASGLSGVWKTTLSEFAAWWRRRSRVRLTVTRKQNRLAVTAERTSDGMPVAVEYLRRRQIATMPLAGRTLMFSPEALAYESRPAVATFRPVRIDRSDGIRGRVRRWIDWERVTPIDQIGTGTWRNWAKRGLRKWWKPETITPTQS